MENQVYAWELDKALPRFLSKIEDYSNVDACWIWKSTQNGVGYGRFGFGGKYWLAHRWIYLYVHGKLEGRLVIDHLCHNTLCVNPRHLEEVTLNTNLSRGIVRGPKPLVIADSAIEEIKSLYYDSGYTQLAIVDKLGVSIVAVRKSLRSTGRRRRRNMH